MKYKFAYSKAGFIKLVKSKKELKGLADSVVEQTLDSCLYKNHITPENLPPSQIKALLKEIRYELRLLAGRFQKTSKKRTISLDFSELFKTHSSTAERIYFYPKLKAKINSLGIHSILDLGCGLNPIALASPKIKYFAVDIKEDELIILDKFFKEKKIRGKTFVFDLRNIKSNSNLLPKTDLCIIFKVLDLLGQQKRVLTEEILNSVKARFFLISFSTIKLSGKPMNQPRRFWFEHILEKLNLGFEKFSSSNEVFYLIENSMRYSKFQ